MSSANSEGETWEHILVSDKSTIEDALLAIDKGAVEIALVVDEHRKLLGTITDGDIRRALLSGATLASSAARYASAHPHVVGPEASRASVLDMMKARRLSQIPIVDEHDRVLGLHVMQDLLGGVKRPNWAVIMAGGRGTRLGSHTEEIPKPMLTVAGRPILERQVLHLVGSGIRSIFISINYLGDVIESHFADGAAFGCRIEYLRETEPLGTGGSLGLLAANGFRPSSPVIVMNGDLVTDFSVEGILNAHQADTSIATVAVHEYTHSVPFGVVSASGNRLLAIEEKPVERWLINAGIYVLEPELIARVPTDGPIGVTGLLQSALQSGDTVSVWTALGEWDDVGQPVDLARVRGEG